MLADLRKLEQKWKQAKPSHADGGRNAVAGFYYQFQATLLRTVIRFLENRAAGSYSVVAESLSDLRVVEDTTVIVTQIKRRHTSQSVGTALDQLWEVYRLAEEFPELRPRLRFEVQAAESDLKSLEARISRWLERRKAATTTAEEVEQFTAAVTVNTIADPARELHAILHERLRATDPVGLSRTWLARLMEASDDEQGFEAVARDIWNDLVGLDGNKKITSDIKLWRDEYAPPSQIEPGAYLTGQRPMLYHLRNGYFAPRPAALDRVRQDFWEWQDSRPAFADNTVKLPVFWLGGRSGVGKSVLLLQLLADLHSQGIARVIWLGNNPGLLSRAMEWVQRAEERDPDQDLLSVIAIDDPYQVSATEGAAQWQEALAIVDDLRQRGEGDRLPLLVCCGPSEQALNLSNDFVDDLIVRQSLVENEVAEDYDELKAWFARRTGSELSQVQRPNHLLVQLFFERHHGASLKEFAARFRARIRSMHPNDELFNVVARVMALNRLYVGYPARAFEKVLTPQQRDAMAHLQAEEHLENRGTGSRQDTWVTHPQLANLMYEAWFPARAEANVRRGHLLQAIQDCYAYGEEPAGKNAPLWALSRALVDKTGDLNLRIADDDIGPLVGEIYQNRVADNRLPLVDLPVWLELAANAPSIEWSPHPAVRTIECIRSADMTTAGLRLTCHKLLQHWTALDGVADSVTDLLARSLTWQDFRPVVIDAVKRLKDPRLGVVVEQWLDGTRSGKRIIGDVLAVTLRSLPRSDRLLDRSAALLQNAPATTSWSEVAVHLLEREPVRYLRAVLAWLEFNRSRRETIFLLEPLLRKAPRSPELGKWAAEWLAASSTDGSHVVRLLTCRYGRADLGVAWLLRNPGEHPYWPHVWEATWEAQGRSDDLAEIGLAWLDRFPEHMAWTQAWKALWDAGCGVDRLRALGHRWLTHRTPLRALPDVWEPLWKVGTDTALLASIGLRWLQGHPDHYRWPHVWGPLQEADAESRQIRDLALAWLDSKTLERHGWHWVWSHLFGQPDINEKLTALAWTQLRAWCLSQDNRIMARWFRLWRDVWESDHADRNSLSVIAVEWLSVSKVNKNWCIVANKTLGHGTSDHLRQAIANKLSEPAPDTILWAEVWLLAWSSGADKTRLGRNGIGWLTANQIKGPWVKMWKAMWDDGRASDVLWDLAIGCLQNHPDHGRWHSVWRLLWHTGMDRSGLRRLAERWLARPDVGDPSGRDVVRDLLAEPDTAVLH
ncbi:hypothetical protein [Micromonospora arida]|uniref:hypothetical protein n=1 Tax=Micromonospora arida TaxID=2203715 RepID=UPI003CFB73A7